MFSVLSSRLIPSSRCMVSGLSPRMFSTSAEKIVSLQTANQQTITKHKIQDAIKKFQIHKSDTGSAAAQIAAATEKLLSLTKHFAAHKKDKASFRGYQVLVARRRKMLVYLKRKNFTEYNAIVEQLGLKGQVREA